MSLVFEPAGRSRSRAGADRRRLVERASSKLELSGSVFQENMNYPGGKNSAGVYQRIICQMPPHSVYVEPFLGSGAVLRYKRPATVNIGFDRDGEAVKAFLSATGWKPIDRSGEPVMRSLLLLYDDESYRAPNGAEYQISQGNAFEFLRGYQWGGSELVYCDPPYLRPEGSRRVYEYELTKAQHRELLSILLGLPCKVLLSGYASRLYSSALKGWRVMRFMAPTRGGPKVEQLWANFPEPVALHDYSFLGENRIERQRIKRNIARWKGKIARMPILERRALMAALLEAGDPPQLSPSASAAAARAVCGRSPADEPSYTRE